MNPPRLAEFEIAMASDVFRRHPEVSSVTLFGSRAKGTASGIKGCTNRGYKSARIIDEAMLRAAEPRDGRHLHDRRTPGFYPPP